MYNKNKGLDIFRVLSLLLVVIYHVWVVTNNQYSFNNIVLDTFIPLGGEIGVTAFFVLSGCSIYLSLTNNTRDYLSYIKKRFIRVAPEYYISVLIVVIFRPIYFTGQYLKHLIATLTFTQNIIPSLYAVNGVLWTMSVTMCFYLLAPLIFRIINKFNMGSVSIVFMIITVMFKAIFFHYLGTSGIVSDWFWLSRMTILTDIDNFVFGMVAGKCIVDSQRAYKWSFFNIVVTIIMLFLICRLGLKNGIHTDNLSGYFWHTLVAGCLALQLFFFGMSNADSRFVRINKVLSIISDNQYGIYVFHLLIISTLYPYFSAYRFDTLAMMAILLGSSVTLSLIISIFIRKVLCRQICRRFTFKN